MNYYNEIKKQIINNQITKKIKDYSKNRSDLQTYYNIGKLLAAAGKHYGEGIIKEYSKKLTLEFGKIVYYINQCEINNLNVKDLRNKIIQKDKFKVEDFIKNPILIKNSYNYNKISEKVLKQLILEDIDNNLRKIY